jgi:hypothetical protein
MNIPYGCRRNKQPGLAGHEKRPFTGLLSHDLTAKGDRIAETINERGKLIVPGDSQNTLSDCILNIGKDSGKNMSS